MTIPAGVPQYCFPDLSPDALYTATVFLQTPYLEGPGVDAKERTCEYPEPGSSPCIGPSPGPGPGPGPGSDPGPGPSPCIGPVLDLVLALDVVLVLEMALVLDQISRCSHDTLQDITQNI